MTIQDGTEYSRVLSYTYSTALTGRGGPPNMGNVQWIHTVIWGIESITIEVYREHIRDILGLYRGI